MAIYEYRCRVCETHFEVRRPMAEAAAPIECPSGHTDTTKLLSVFASTAGSTSRPTVVAAPSGGCGSSCACAH